jgi:hypothetical protein
MISGTAGSTSFFLKKSCLETKRFSRHVWRVNDVARPKTVEGRKDLQSFSKHSRTPITRVTMRPVSGLAILSLNPSLQMKLTDDYAAGNTDAHKSPANEFYKKGCQEKSSPSTGGRGFGLDLQPTVVSLA